jgi:CO/xanthine dehydrogenase FAD-binding subunit
VQSLKQAVDALRSELAPIPDLTHSQAAKRQLAAVLLKRALTSWMPTVETT